MTAVSPASVLPRRFSRTGHTCAVRLETWDLTDVPSLRQGGPPGKEEARTEGLENDEIQFLIVGSLMYLFVAADPATGPAAAHGALRLRPARAGRGLAF